MVKPKAELRYNTGKKAACIMGGIGNGKVLMWEENKAKKWSGKAACTMYEKVLIKAPPATTGPITPTAHEAVGRASYSGLDPVLIRCRWGLRALSL